MKNQLKEVERNLRYIAKRNKGITFSIGLALVYLMLGVNAFSEEVAANMENQVASKETIGRSADNLSKVLKEIKEENDKKLKGAQLELVQLMEQGDQVVKSPWSSWQFGMNYIYKNWSGTYRGRGDKKQKYPYEGIFTRDSGVNEMNRYISSDSSYYSTLVSESNPTSASSNRRKNLGQGYGLGSTQAVPEPIVDLELSAGITPRFINKGAIILQAPQPATPNVPKAINFKPVTPNIAAPEAPIVEPPSITAPATGNGDDMYIKDGGNSTALVGTLSNADVGMIAQQKIEAKTAGTSGELNVNLSNNKMDINWKGIKFTGQKGAAHTTSTTYDIDKTTTGYTGYAAMKLVGGHRIDINDAKIKFEGIGTTSYNRWLFHTDGHNDHGESTWVIGNGTTIDISGNNLVLYTSQYHHNNKHYNIGFVNSGKISTSGSGNIGWVNLSESGSEDRVQYFHNKNGSIDIRGTGDIFAYIMTKPNGRWNITNEGDLKLSGSKQFGIVVSNKGYGVGVNDIAEFKNSEILLNKEMTLTGSESVGAVFRGWADLDGGSTQFSQSQANNIVTAMNATSKESIFKFKLDGTKNIGMYFGYEGDKTFEVKDLTITSIGDGNTGIYVANGTVNISDKNSATEENTITMSGKKSIGVFAAAPGKTLNSGVKIAVTGDASTGIFAKNSGDVTSTGEISASGKSVKAIIADGSKIDSSGKITVNGEALSAADGAVGLVAQNGGNLISTGAGTNISVKGSASIAAYANNGNLDIQNAILNTTEGAFNTYAANSGTIELKDTVLNTGQKSLAFFTDDTGKIDFTGGNVVANIAGWTGNDPLTRGTAFYYTGAGYSPFGIAQITAWKNARFPGMSSTTLTLNMASGSRLFIASDVGMNLSDTNASGLAGALGANIVGNDYKTFMLYLSELKLDQDVNLDSATDAYNLLEISNSRIINNNSKKLEGTKNGQVAMAQENLDAVRDKVQLINEGTMSLTGANSTAMYSKFGELANTATGTIKMGDSSTALYGINNSLVSNQGTIEIGSNSTALYSKEATVGTGAPQQSPIVNSGTIRSKENNAIGIIYDGKGYGTGSDIGVNNANNAKINFSGDKSVGIYAQGTKYIVENNGEITLGDSASMSNPNVGIFTDIASIGIANRPTGNIKVGKNAIGVYGHRVVNEGNIEVGNSGVGIYSKANSVVLESNSKITVGEDEAVAVYLEQGGGSVNSKGELNIGNNSFGFVAIAGAHPLNFYGDAIAKVNLGNKSVYLYSNDKSGIIINNTALKSTANENYGIYSAGSITNNANIDFSTGIGNVALYSILGGAARNTATITVGDSDAANSKFGIAMAAGYEKTDTGRLENAGILNINGKNSIGMYATGVGSVARNSAGATINLAADGAIGMYLDNGAKGFNDGTITTIGTPNGAVGVVVRGGAEFTNNGNIHIDSPNGYAFFKAQGGIIKNYGTFTLGSGAKKEFAPGSKPTGKEVGGVKIDAPAGADKATITLNGVTQPIVSITNPIGQRAPLTSSIGMYIDTLKGTNPIGGLLPSGEADLIIGAEASQVTNSKYINLSGTSSIIDPYNKAILANPQITSWKIYSGAMTWIATATLDQNTGLIKNIYLAKIPYTSFAGNEPSPVDRKDTYNFLDGLEQRYGVEELGSRENQLFKKLNSIGKNEEILFFQAVDEMMGHQYANIQQRIHSTGRILDKEFDYLKDEWRTASKDSNKIKVFGMKGEYSTDTAGVIDYKNNAYGVAYVGENETIKLGKSSGWYTGLVHNKFDFKDIGNSKEEMLQAKLGLFKTTAFDDNGSLNWTISGEAFAGYNKMHRRFLVVDEIFNARSKYWSYGVALKNELSKTFRLSEDFSLRGYASLKAEYGRFQKIKEKSGEVRLEIKSNDYISVKPEIGGELIYKTPLSGRNFFNAKLGLKYENELGRVANAKNKARVAHTNADWFNIRGEKEDRRGNVGADLSLGWDNEVFGITANIGYDTKGKNKRAGLGLRVIF